MKLRLACAVAITFAVLLAAGAGFALGAQAQRFGRCQQLSNQYIGTMAMSVPDTVSGTFKTREINAARAAYQQECT